MMQLYIYVSLYLMSHQIIVQATPKLVLPEERTTGLGCIPVGSTVSYQCTVTDDSSRGVGSTVWNGNVFNCSSLSQISLNHPQFLSGMSCGDLVAIGVRVNGTEYTSKLTLTATLEMNGRMINCTFSSIDLVGSDNIRVGAIPPPPGQLTVIFSPESSLIVSWSSPSGPMEGGVGEYVFGVAGDGCGCRSKNISNDSSSVECSGWSAMGQNCSFEVRTLSQDCGLPSDPITESISLAKPPAPTELLVSSVLLINNTIQVKVEFVGVTAPKLGASLDPTVHYTVVVTRGNSTFENFTNVLCDLNNKCTSINNVTDLSSSENINVSVVAYNIFGSGPRTCYRDCNLLDLGFNQTFITSNGPGKFNISNGIVLYTGVTPRSVASVVCVEGYIPSSNRTCMFGGQWSEGNLSCEVMPESTTSSQGPSGTGPGEVSCPTSCIVSITVVVFVVMALLAFLCIVLFAYIVCKFCRKRRDSKSDEQSTNIMLNTTTLGTVSNSTSASQDQTITNTTAVNLNEEPPTPQLDNYAEPKDLIQKPHLSQRRYEGDGEKAISKTDHGGGEPAQYESIQEVRLSKPSTPHDQSSRELYSEVFDALPKGRPAKVMNKSS